MGSLTVACNGKLVDPDLFILLYMPPELKDKVADFLREESLDKKFDVWTAEIGVSTDEDGVLADGIKSLMLMMTSDRVLFEYKLSNKQDKLLSKINDYVYGKEES